jgi:hypothetical protein
MTLAFAYASMVLVALFFIVLFCGRTKWFNRLTRWIIRYFKYGSWV